MTHFFEVVCQQILELKREHSRSAGYKIGVWIHDNESDKRWILDFEKAQVRRHFVLSEIDAVICGREAAVAGLVQRKIDIRLALKKRHITIGGKSDAVRALSVLITP